MTYGQISWLCLIAATACTDAPRSVDAGACVNEPDCTCGDGLKGTKVCDLDTHDYVMCLCNRSRATPVSDAGVEPRDAAVSGRAGRGASGSGRADAAVGGNQDPGTAARSGGRDDPAAQGGDGAEAGDGAPAAGAPSGRGGSGGRDGRDEHEGSRKHRR